LTFVSVIGGNVNSSSSSIMALDSCLRKVGRYNGLFVQAARSASSSSISSFDFYKLGKLKRGKFDYSTGFLRFPIGSRSRSISSSSNSTAGRLNEKGIC
jgi:hypothetical protein